MQHQCIFSTFVLSCLWPSVLRRCWLGGTKGIRSAKKREWWGAGMVTYLQRGADLQLHMAQLMPLPLTVSCFSKIQIGFTFLVLATRVVLDKGLLNGCVLFAAVFALKIEFSVLTLKPCLDCDLQLFIDVLSVQKKVIHLFFHIFLTVLGHIL